MNLKEKYKLMRKTVILSFRISKTLEEKLNKRVKKEGVPKTFLICEALERFLK